MICLMLSLTFNFLESSSYVAIGYCSYKFIFLLTTIIILKAVLFRLMIALKIVLFSKRIVDLQISDFLNDPSIMVNSNYFCYYKCFKNYLNKDKMIFLKLQSKLII